MTAESSTHTYESGVQETVTLRRGPATPHDCALLKITYSDGEIADCYVNTAWLRDRADQLADTPRPLTPDDITDEMVVRAQMEWERRNGAAPIGDTIREILTAALTEPTMTEYTADDFKTARFATHPDGKIAARNWDGDHGPWWAQMPAGNWMGRSDTLMALDGWIPVQEVNR